MEHKSTEQVVGNKLEGPDCLVNALGVDSNVLERVPDVGKVLSNIDTLRENASVASLSYLSGKFDDIYDVLEANSPAISGSGSDEEQSASIDRIRDSTSQLEKALEIGCDSAPEMASVTAHSGPVWCLRADGNTLISSSNDKLIKIWDVSLLRCLGTLEKHEESVNTLCIVDHNMIFSGSDDRTVKVWDRRTRELITSLEGHEDWIRALHFAHGYVLSGSGDTNIRVWDPRKHECVKILTGHTGGVRSLASYENKLFSGSGDKTIGVWDLETLQTTGETLEGHKDWVWSLLVHNDRLYSGGTWPDKSIRVWKCDEVECIKVVQGHADSVLSLAAHSKYLFSGGGMFDKNLRVWNIDSMKCEMILQGHARGVTSMVPHQSGWLFSGSWDRSIRVWAPSMFE